ncbi:MAG: Crp/Fnr family transcriptional regulator [Bacteroidales bacterium]|jgi:CRP-like cAMP-binding protein|nr:Crp/Fnr family transcriptional regulator [Bacteroidales bacterium]
MDSYQILADQFKQIDFLSNQEIIEICQYFKAENIPKNHFFLEEGRRCTKIGFLVKGILCSFKLDQNGEGIVKHFIEPNQFFSDIESYNKSKPANLNIQAVIDSSILSLSKEDHKRLQKDFPQLKHTLSIFSSQALNNMIQMQNFLYFGSALEKYKFFVENHPNLARHVPLKLISSYLGITQSSLSRIRRENF